MCIRNRRKSIERYEAKYASLAQSFYVNPERCENPEHFEEYIRYNALGDYRSGMATTHVLVEYEDDMPLSICGYVAIKATSLITGTDTLNGYPALEIAEFAVNKYCENQGNGRILLQYVVRLCDELREKIGIKYLLVCAEKNAEPFYRHVLPFQNAGDYYSIPREQWNEDCIPLYFWLPEKNSEPRYVNEDDE